MDGHTDTFTEMLTAALFKIAPTCEKQNKQIVIYLYNEILLKNY